MQVIDFRLELSVRGIAAGTGVRLCAHSGVGHDDAKCTTSMRRLACRSTLFSSLAAVVFSPNWFTMLATKSWDEYEYSRGFVTKHFRTRVTGVKTGEANLTTYTGNIIVRPKHTLCLGVVRAPSRLQVPLNYLNLHWSLGVLSPKDKKIT